MSSLYIFPFEYPYGTRESFLDDELPYLSKRFEKIYLVPDSYSPEKGIRNIPRNCSIITTKQECNKFRRLICGLFSFRTINLILYEFFAYKVYADKVRFKNWISFSCSLNNHLHDKRYNLIQKQLKKDDVCYFYWGVGKNALSIFWHRKAHMVSRFHGDWDLWEESYHGYVPFREKMASTLDRAIFISKKGGIYFEQKHKNCEISVCPLGSKDYGINKQKVNNDKIIRVVSCSTMWALKRVDLIFDSLNTLNDYTIEWTHIGDGPEFERVKSIIENNRKNHLNVKLLGKLAHDDVVSYYQNNHVDLFINLSTNEGVPVSIMEAASFGIPVLATNVGSTCEAVSEQVGELLPPNPTKEEVASMFRKMLKRQYSPRTFWETHYNADVNYQKFVDLLVNLESKN